MPRHQIKSSKLEAYFEKENTEFFIEASEAGLPPGEWPMEIEVVGEGMAVTTVCRRHERNPDGGFTYIDDLGISVMIFND